MRLFINGGGSGDKVFDIYSEINDIIDHDKPALYVPLAMEEDKHPYDGCYEWIKSEIAAIDVPFIKMVRSFEELCSLNYSDYSFIFIGGGNTFRLLKGLKDSGSFNKLKDFIINDGIVFGGSAGSVIMGYDVSCSMDDNNVGLEDTIGLNMLGGYSLFPHYTNYKSKLSEKDNKERMKLFTDRIIEYTKRGFKIIALPEEDTICIKGETSKVKGTKNYYEFIDGKLIEKEPTNGRNIKHN